MVHALICVRDVFLDGRDHNVVSWCVDTRTSSTQCSAWAVKIQFSTSCTTQKPLDRKWICSGCQKEPHSSQPWNTPPKKRTSSWNCYPIGSMYGIYANIGDILMVNATIYSIHTWILWLWRCLSPATFRIEKRARLRSLTPRPVEVAWNSESKMDLSDLSELICSFESEEMESAWDFDRFCTSTYFTAKHCVFIAEEKGDDSPLCLEQGASPEAASYRSNISNQLGCTGQESQASQASRWNSWAKQRDRNPNHYWLMDLFSRDKCRSPPQYNPFWLWHLSKKILSKNTACSQCNGYGPSQISIGTLNIGGLAEPSKWMYMVVSC